MCWSRLRLRLRSREVHLGHCPRSFRGGEIRVVGFEPHTRREHAGRKLLHVSVVVLQGIVVALALDSDAVFGSREFVLQTQEILI